MTHHLGKHNEPSASESAARDAVRAIRERVAELPPEQHEEVHSLIDQIEETLEKGPKTLSTPRAMITELFTYWPDAVPWLTSQADLILRSLGGG